MIRRAYLTTSFIIGLVFAGAGFASLWQYVGYRGMLTERHWIVAEIDDGNLSLGHSRSTDLVYPNKARFIPQGFFGRVGIQSGSYRRVWRYLIVTLPLWVVVLALFIHPAVAFLRGPMRRRLRRNRGQCIECGYDLRGNTSGVCPECGAGGGGLPIGNCGFASGESSPQA